MQIGLFAPLTSPMSTPDYLAQLGRTAEERGFHSLWVAEHVVLFDEYESQYPYAANGRIPAGGENGILEPLTSLAFLAAHTERIRLGTGILLVPQRNPVYTAKEVANVDWLSKGRVDLGVGVGWLAEEFEAVDVSFERRGARCSEYLRVMQQLWQEPISEFEGEFYRLPACRQYPKPVQTPHPPLHFGGESLAAMRRVADLGQGWYPFNLTPEEVGPAIQRLEKVLADRGRSRSSVQISTCPYMRPIEPDMAPRYQDAGVDQLILVCFAPDAASLAPTLDGLASQVSKYLG